MVWGIYPHFVITLISFTCAPLASPLKCIQVCVPLIICHFTFEPYIFHFFLTFSLLLLKHLNCSSFASCLHNSQVILSAVNNTNRANDWWMIMYSMCTCLQHVGFILTVIVHDMFKTLSLNSKNMILMEVSGCFGVAGLFKLCDWLKCLSQCVGRICSCVWLFWCTELCSSYQRGVGAGWFQVVTALQSCFQIVSWNWTCLYPECKFAHEWPGLLCLMCEETFCFLTCAVKSAGKMIGFLVWVCGDSRENRPWAFLWAPQEVVTPESKREEECDPLLLRGASRHKKSWEQSVILQELFSHLRVKWLPAN